MKYLHRFRNMNDVDIGNLAWNDSHVLLSADIISSQSKTEEKKSQACLMHFKLFSILNDENVTRSKMAL